MTWYSPPNQAQRQYLLAHLDFGKTVSHMKDHTGSYLWDYNVTLFNFSVETVITTKFRSEDTHSLFWSIILCIVAVKFLWLNLHDFSLFWGFSGSSAGKESTCNAGDPGSIPGSGKTPGKGIGYPFQYSWDSLVAQLVKNSPAMWETWVQSLGWENLLEKAWQPTLVFLPEKSLWSEAPGGLQPMRLQRVGQDWETKHSREPIGMLFLNLWFSRLCKCF